MSSSPSSSSSSPTATPRAWPDSLEIRKLVWEFITESVEALAYIYVLLVIAERSVNWSKVIKVSAFLGAVQTVLMYVDDGARLKVKDGMKQSIGNTAVMRIIRL